MNIQIHSHIHQILILLQGMRRIGLFIVLLQLAGLTCAQYITQIGCTNDVECNMGKCIDHTCTCSMYTTHPLSPYPLPLTHFASPHLHCTDDLYFPQDVEGTFVPCIVPYGRIHPAAALSLAIIYAIVMSLLLVTHISVVSRKKG